MEGQEENRTEEATPFKLKRAREKGQVARGMDLGFVGSLVALIFFALAAGAAFAVTLAQIMRRSLTIGIERASDPFDLLALGGAALREGLYPLMLLGIAIVLILVALELIQLRGLIFSFQPLKPDFTRLNPAQGIKRLFSLRMLKETLKNIVKMICYAAAAWLVIAAAIEAFGNGMAGTGDVVRALKDSAGQLVLAFLGLAIVFTIIDQLIVRREFRRQMRMSRRELTREAKEREGEPRIKQKRKQLHARMAQQARGLERVAGADLLVTNPDHYAVALYYDAEQMNAPVIRARGRNIFAQLMKRKARLSNVPIFANPPLARALYHQQEIDQPIASDNYRAVASLYIRLRERDAARAEPEGHQP